MAYLTRFELCKLEPHVGLFLMLVSWVAFSVTGSLVVPEVVFSGVRVVSPSISVLSSSLWLLCLPPHIRIHCRRE